MIVLYHLPRDLAPRILVISFRLLPSRNMDVDELSILLGGCLLHDINYFLRTSLYGEICVRASEIGT